ncbi:MAG: DedA family protein [Armatimonadota bacterium]
MLLESACIPVPSEAIMPFAGFAVSEGTMTLFGITVAGVAGNLIGSWIAYWVGLYGGRPFIDKYGKYVLLRHHHVELAERWFAKYGPVTVFFSRMLPIVRTFISLPAGIAKMPFWKFTLYTTLGCIPWVFFLGWLGTRLCAHWEDIRPYLHYADYAVVVALAAISILGTMLLMRAANPNGSPEQQVRQTIEQYDIAVQRGDLSALRGMTCGATRDGYADYDDHAWADLFSRVSAARQYPVIASIDQVVVNGEHAEANVTAFMAYDPQVRSTRSLDLQYRDNQWKICQSSGG